MIKILCADDDRVTLEIYKKIFTEPDFEGFFCTNGEEVIELLSEVTPDLILLDVEMPIMNGIKCCSFIRKNEETFNIPIIMVSGLDSEDGITAGLSNGADDYITKPVKKSELLAKVKMTLQKRAATKSLSMNFAPNSTFAGRYKIKEKIASGGTSTVFKAKEINGKFTRLIALKIYDLPLSKINDEKFTAMFLREANAHQQINHSNICKLHDFGLAGGFYYLALEHLEGQPLLKVVQRMKNLAVDTSCYISLNICNALIYMESKNIIHRDVKPENIIITNKQDIKLLDFGLARNISDNTLSLEDEFRGSPYFVSPEYIDGIKTLNISTDVYSLGVTFYYMLTGKFPITGKNILKILENHKKMRPVSVNQLLTDFPEDLSELIDGMLEKESTQRPKLLDIKACLKKYL